MNKVGPASCLLPTDNAAQVLRLINTNAHIDIVSSRDLEAGLDEIDLESVAAGSTAAIRRRAHGGTDQLQMLIAPDTDATLASIVRSTLDCQDLIAPVWILDHTEHGAVIARPAEIRISFFPYSSPLSSAKSGTPKKEDEKIHASAQWLTENCEHDISIAEVAQAAAMSERTFLRRFRQQIGTTPSEYLLRARLERSCRLLAEGDLPVDKIARRSGMGNGSQLAKLFRKRFRVSPTEFRRRARAGTA
ncbi:AraC family transcriptional regulator [Paraburkholderia caledonica]|uniref:AraC-like DNA-binding protein n=1 Tax=Paraburkholderia caledonica TaxID=134536 RepID=A0ABU1KZH9_9BURK|nr:AraC family transcriptional regulator [Paraburkholderia caledonica]MDR6376329.1 AraC-like DNA-binding protein [Paraburkholderia caledonica]